MGQTGLRTSVALAALLCASCAHSGGSVGDFDPDAEPIHRPDWLGQLDENLEHVPPELLPEGPELETPTDWRGELSGRGLPSDLTARIRESSGSQGASRPAPASAPAGPRGGPGYGVAPVTVHVHSAENRDDEPVLPATPSNEVSTLERAYAGEASLTPSRSIRQFGYEYFQQMESDEAPAGPVADDYAILPGDELLVVLSGSLVSRFERVVQRDGSVELGELGSVVVAGRRQSELNDVLDAAVDAAGLENVRASASLGRLRGFQIHVVGEVAQPGMLEVPGRATVLSALAAAGPKKSGSLRRIQLRRDGQLLSTIDLYEFLITGDTQGLTPLEPNDVIVIPPIGRTIGVAGLVQRPGIYETVRDQPTVESLLQLAGGLTPFTFLPHAQLERTTEGRGRERREIALEGDGLTTELEDGELLLIGAVDSERQPMVEVLGEVVRPGRQPFRDGMRIRDLLLAADGLTVDAYLPRAFLSRRVGEPGVVTLVPGREAVQTTERILIIDLERALAGDPRHDVELRPLDSLKVTARDESAPIPTVEVLGAVRKPGTYRLTAGLRVSDLVAISGHVVPEVFYDEAELLRRYFDSGRGVLDVERYRFDLGEALRNPGTVKDPLLANSDQLVIRALQDARVRVKIGGRVRFPGEYVFPHGARITDLIAAAGGPLADADLRAASFSRESVRQMQQERFGHLKAVLRAYLEKNFEERVDGGFPSEGLGARLQLNQSTELLDRMSKLQANGRIVVPFTKQDFPRSDFDLTLREGDALMIPTRSETVTVLGHVFNPGAVVAEKGLTVEDLLARAGGVHEHGSADHLYVLRADGTVQSFRQEQYPLAMSTHVYAGDAVMVPKEILDRSLYHRLADLVFLGRRGAELAYVLSRLGDDFPLNFTSVLQSDSGAEVDVLGDTLIEK